MKVELGSVADNNDNALIITIHNFAKACVMTLFMSMLFLLILEQVYYNIHMYIFVNILKYSNLDHFISYLKLALK